MQFQSINTLIPHLQHIEIFHQKGVKKHLYRDADGTYVVSSKTELQTKTAQPQRLTFRDIVLNCYTHKDSLLQCPQAAESLKRMSSQKFNNDDKRNLFVRLALLIMDYCKNFFNGYGMRSTTSLASELVERSKKNRPNTLSQSTPPQPASKIVYSDVIAPCPSFSDLTERKNLYNQQLEANQKTPLIKLEKEPQRKIDYITAREQYIKNPLTCDLLLKSSLFFQMNEETATSLIDLLSTSQDKTQFIFDLIKHANKGVAEEVIKKVDMNLSTITKGFEKLIDSAKEESGLLFNSILLTFIHKYDQKYLSTSQSNNLTLPVTHPAVISVFCLALDRLYTCDGEILKYLTNLLKKEEFNIDMYIKLISVFKAKQVLHHDKEAVYTSKNMLIDHFKNSQKLKNAFKTVSEYETLKPYFIQIGALS